MAKQQRILGAKANEKKAQKITPNPRAIDGKDWEIKEDKHGGFINRNGDNPVMSVPLGESDRDFKIRLHERAHVLWTPEIETEKGRDIWVERGLEFDTVNAVEDSRIAKLMRNHDPEWRRIIDEVDTCDNDNWNALQRMLDTRRNADDNPEAYEAAKGRMPSYLDLGRQFAAFKGTHEEHKTRAMFEGKEMGDLIQLVDQLYDEHFSDLNPTFKNTLDFCESLEQNLRQKEQQKAQVMQGLIDAANAEREELEEYFPEKFLDCDDGEWDGEKMWQDMQIVHVPLTVPMPRGIRAKKKKNFTEGSTPNKMYRLLTDQKVFGRKINRKIDGGSILIDLSGSMSLSTEQVLAIMAQWPGVLMATYSGDGDENNVLRIIASKGKRAKDEELAFTFGGNEVDGPALKWLAKQKAPRVWISDGLVCASTKAPRMHLVRDCANTCKKAKIVRIDNVQELIG